MTTIADSSDTDSYSAAPVVIGGLGRCGSTFLQGLLSAHPDIHIYGQFPPAKIVDLIAFKVLQDRLVEAGTWSQSANQTPICDWPHYAGSDEQRTRQLVGDLVKNWLCGFPVLSKPQWGLKALSLAYHEPYRRAWESWFPETRYVICVRDPFDSFQSAKNTVAPDAVLNDWLQRFVQMVRRHSASDRSHFFHLAGIAAEDRQRAVDDLFNFLDLPASDSMNRVVDAWPTVHKRKPDAERVFALTALEREQNSAQIEGLQEAMSVLRNAQ